MTLISQAKNIWAIILDNSTDTLCDIRESRSYIEIISDARSSAVRSVGRSRFTRPAALCHCRFALEFWSKTSQQPSKYVTEQFILQFSCHHSYKVFNLFLIVCVGWKLHVWKPNKWCNSSNKTIAYHLKVYVWPAWRHRWHKIFVLIDVSSKIEVLESIKPN